MKEKPSLCVSTIKCDYCDWVNDTPTLESELESWLNKPCPKCGKNLLTEMDFKKHKKFLNIIKFMEKIKFVKDPSKVTEGNGVLMEMHIEKFNGKHEVSIKLSEGDTPE